MWRAFIALHKQWMKLHDHCLQISKVACTCILAWDGLWIWASGGIRPVSRWRCKVNITSCSSPMVLHAHSCQLSTGWGGQKRPRAFQVAVCANAIRALSPGQGFHLIHIRLREPLSTHFVVFSLGHRVMM